MSLISSRRIDPLRIGVIAPISWRVPPRHYGPWEQFVSLLTEGLVDRGHTVTLFATADSKTGAELVGSAPCGYSENPELDAKVWECLNISAAFERSSDFDVLHNSFDFLPLSYSRLVDTPVITTIHGFSSEKILPVYRKYNATNHYVAISESDRHPSLEYCATIHHGIDMEAFVCGRGPRDYLLFFGRIHPHKGTARAIEVARRAEKPLVIAGIVQDRDYFERAVAPHINGTTVKYVGSVGPEQKSELLGGACALLHLVDFDEPFGFSVVESMACGTPVIATRRGSMSELIRTGVNGYLMESFSEDEESSALDDATRGVVEVASLRPEVVRESVEGRFDKGRMIDDYVSVYDQIARGRRAQSGLTP